jgi:murein DD-endopeptidase MepM/ murein hydrolase activator NlpD
MTSLAVPRVRPDHRARHAKPTSFGRRGLRAAFVALLVFPGIFGVIALPHHGGSLAAARSTDGHDETGAQLLTVADWNRLAVDRDHYSATSMAELTAARAAAAAAAAAVALAEAEAAAEAAAAKERLEADVDQSTTSPDSSETYVNLHDSELTAFLVGRSDPWIRPVGAAVSSPYGPREIICNPEGCSSAFHDGVDFGAACETPVTAVSAGRVVFVGSAGSYGNRVIVDHGGGIESIYGHLQDDSYLVTVGDLIETGTVVGLVGATGVVTGCHLDLKIRVDGKFTSPVPFLLERGVSL